MEQSNQPADRLYRGSQLKEAHEWAAHNTVSRQEQAFLQASAAAHLRALIALGVAIFLVITSSGVAGWFFLNRPHTPNYVTTVDEHAVGSLRWAIANASSGSTITFDPNLIGQTIVLKNADIHIIQQSLTIRGLQTGHIVIQELGASFFIDAHTHVTISDITFQGSKTPGKSSLINNGKLNIENCVFSGNTNAVYGNNIGIDAGGTGGGGILNYGILTIMKSTISGNTEMVSDDPNSANLSSGGGGICNQAGTLTIINSTISGNTIAVTGGNDGSGGGIYNFAGTLSVINSAISGNKITVAGKGSGHGSGISNDSGTLTIANSIISDNAITAPDQGLGGGGGIDSGGSGSGGGIIINAGGILRATNSLISNNSIISSDRQGVGGGISNNDGGTLTIANSTISGNTVTVIDTNNIGSGSGGIFISPSSSSRLFDQMIIFCTIFNNSISGGNGSDMYVDTPLSTTLQDSIVGNNADTKSAHPHIGIGGEIARSPIKQRLS